MEICFPNFFLKGFNFCVSWLYYWLIVSLICLSPEKYVGRIDVYNGGLTFNKVTRQDNGVYSCEVSGNNGYGEVEIKLTVQGGCRNTWHQVFTLLG